MPLKDKGVLHSTIKCYDCTHEWGIDGRAYETNNSIITFLRVRGRLLVCPICRESRNLRISHNTKDVI